MSTQTVTTLQSLPQFYVPDTSGYKAGSLFVGTYPVIATEMRGTDEYVQLGTWICSKSNGVVYAVVNEPTPPITEGVDEAALTTMLQTFRGYSYNVSYPKYSSPIPNVPGLPLAPPKQNSCCIFIEDLVVHAFQYANFAFAWTQHKHDQMMVADWNDLFSPPHALSEPGDGCLGLPTVEPKDSQSLPPPWSVCQGWGPTSGHTFIIIAYHSANDRVLMLDSSSAHGYSGPGLRGLGDLDQFLSSGPPDDWWDEKKYPNVPTWTQLRATYSTGIAYSQLKVLTSTLRWGRSF